MKNICNCGRPTRYSFISQGEEVSSCNKYCVCPSYEELQERAKKVFLYEMYLRKIVDTSAMDYEYRTWAKMALDGV